MSNGVGSDPLGRPAATSPDLTDLGPGPAPSSADTPALVVFGHGTRDSHGLAEHHRLLDVVRATAPGLAVSSGFIELAQPDLDTALEAAIAAGACAVVAVPLLLLGASHLKVDGPDALARARQRHPAVPLAYGRHLGVHPTLIELATARARAAVEGLEPAEQAVVLVARGSKDPDANADLAKIARLLADRLGRGLVEPAFVSAAWPTLSEALERCRRLGATSITVVPYLLFSGALIGRIDTEAARWADDHPGVLVRLAGHLGPDPGVARLILERYEEARRGEARMNCDGCTYRPTRPGPT